MSFEPILLVPILFVLLGVFASAYFVDQIRRALKEYRAAVKEYEEALKRENL